MARIEIPEHLMPGVYPHSMDSYSVDVRLRDGRVYYGLAARGDTYITGRESDPDGVGDLDFSTEDIVAVRNALPLLLRWWPF